MAEFNINRKEIQFSYTAQYCISQTPTGHEKEIWVVLHGYGQLAEFFLKKFGSLFGRERLIVAPEATNYGYLKNFSGRVGANWMTKHKRELAISNNHLYLNNLLEKVLHEFDHLPKINVLGFSQGAATATRWVGQLDHSVEKLVLWGGGFAHDLQMEKASEKLKKAKIILTWGEEDEFISKEALEKQEELIRQMNLKVLRYTYLGGHDLDLPLLKKIFCQDPKE